MGISKDKIRIQVLLSQEEAEHLKEQAQKQYRNRSQLVGFLIKKYLKECGYPVDIDTSQKE